MLNVSFLERVGWSISVCHVAVGSVLVHYGTFRVFLRFE